ncbi:MAG: Appr-1-p processing protein, partial [Planctomycetota bacterium]
TQESAESGKGGNPGRAKLEHVNHALKVLRRVADNEGVASLALPRLATGVGGLEWGPVKELIESHFSDAAYPVLLYHEYHKGVHASERLPATSR